MLDTIYSAMLSKDAHLYEIDKEKLKNVYNFTQKKKKVYKVYERKIIYANGESNVIVSKSEMEKSYFGDYKFFRDYLLSGYESDDIQIELNEIKSVLNLSKNLREKVQNKFKIVLDDDSHGDSADEKKSGNIVHTKKSSPSLKFGKNRKSKNNYPDNFVKMCRLFTIKSSEEKVYNKPIFKLYSELNTPTDAFSQTMSENQINSNFVYYKKKLTKSYYLEEFLYEFAKNYYASTNDNIPTTIDPLPKEIRQKFPIESIDSTFRARGSEAFSKIDSFMSKYGISQKSHLYERDLYENIYDILSKCNYANFLSFLYSKNDLFKYLYNEFTIKKDIINPLEDTKISRIDSCDSEDNTKGEFLSTYQKENRNRRVSLRIGTNIEDFYGSYFVDRICFISEKMDDKIIDHVLQKSQSAILIEDPNSIEDLQNNVINFLSYACAKEFQHTLILTKNERLKISNISPFSVDNQDLNKAISGDIDEDIKRTKFFKIDKNCLWERLYYDNVSPLDEIFSFSKCFYIVEIKTSLNKGRRNSADLNKKLKNDNSLITFYYLIRTSNENIERFEMALNQLKLLEIIEPAEKTTKRVSCLVKPETKVEEEKKFDDEIKSFKGIY